jgi:hypothetical protein
MDEEFDNWSEEELRTRVIYPWLIKHGFQPAEVNVEMAFQVRIGRDKVKLPRVDVLVRRGDRPLFAVECKRPSHDFTPVDREQVISYARLAQPQIAPLAILTNGAQTEILDSLTSRPIDSLNRAEIESWQSIGVEELIRVQTEAISRLLCLSAVQLHGFVTREISRITSRSALRPSYDKTCHVPRPGIAAELYRQCVEGSGQITVLMGASTIGKSSELLASADEWLRAEPWEVLPLYVPLNLSGPDFLAYLTESFGWQFRQIDSAVELVTTIDRIALAHRIKCVAYLLDGGDIVDLDQLRQNIERFVASAETLSCRHRIILSLQASTWGYLRGGQGIDLGRRMGEREIRLEPLDPAQQRALRAKLENRYGVSLARLPLPRQAWGRPALVAIAAQLAQDSSGAERISVAELWRRFLEHQLHKSKSTHRSAIIGALARLAGDKVVDGDEVWLDEACTVGIIQPQETAHFRRTFVFCEEWACYYLQCFILWRLDDAPAERLGEIVTASIDHQERRALEWYLYNIGGDERWRYTAECTHHGYLESMRSLTRRIRAVCVDAGVTLCLAPGSTHALPWFSLVPGREPIWTEREAMPSGTRMMHEFAPFAPRRYREIAVEDVKEHLRGIAQWLRSHFPDASHARPPWLVQGAIYERLVERLVGPIHSLDEIAAMMLEENPAGAQVIKAIFTQGLALARKIAEDEFGAFASQLPHKIRIELDVSERAFAHSQARFYQMPTNGACVEIDVVLCGRDNRSDKWGFDFPILERHGVLKTSFGTLAPKLIDGGWPDPYFQNFSWRSPEVRTMRVPAVVNVARDFLEDLLSSVQVEEILDAAEQ